MPDTLGNITVPEVTPSGVFPLSADFPYTRTISPSVVAHRFGAGNTKIEQRFLLGDGLKRWIVGKSELTDDEVDALQGFWEGRKGAYTPFTFNAPDGEAYTVRFQNEPLTVERLVGAISSTTCTLVDIPTAFPAYAVAATVTRFPSDALNTALLSQVQEIIPLIKIQPLELYYPAIYLSDRRVTIGGQLYQARLLDWDGISQSLGNESDEAKFTFGNADRVMRALVNDVDLMAAVLEFSVFHVGTTIKLDLWKGAVTSWDLDSGPEFRLTASDGIYEITLPYPPRKISRTCWKRFDDGVTCPYTAQGSLDLTHFAGASALACDRGYDTPNGCQAHSMSRYYGGIVAKPQGVRITDNGSGTIFKLGRSMVTATSLVADSIYGRPLKEVYTDIPMPVNCDISAGRDESDFYSALGIVGEGPLGAYGAGHKLDGQYHHGYPGPLGLREVLGNDPATGGVTPADADTHFSLGQSGNQVTDWTKEYVGNSTYENNFAAGTAFIEMRRSDEKGIQLTKLDSHSMQAIISQGISGWVWTDASTRVWGPLINPVWIAINALLRARGLRNATATTQKLYFDVDAAMASAAICDSLVTSLVTGENETQFKFCGVIETEKPLRDWITEILANCLGYYTFSFGRLKIGLRKDSSTVSAFTGPPLGANVIWQSMKLAPIRPQFNHLTATFADSEFEFVANAVTVQDDDHAALRGGGAGPLYLKGQLNLAGTASKSQAGRIATVRLREELGGINAAEWKVAREVSWATTVLALEVEPGMVVSINDTDLGSLSEFRVTGWKLNRDYSIELQGRTTTDSMYDLVAGPKAADVTADPVPPEFFPAPLRPVWHPNTVSPDYSDPMFDEFDRTFNLTQEYIGRADDTAQVLLIVDGALPPNDVVPDTVAPVVRAYSVADTGGFHPDDVSAWVCVAPRNAAGEHGPHSNIVQVRTPSGDGSNLITLSDIEWPPGTWVGYTLFGCYEDGRMICEQEEQTGAFPASVDWVGPASRSTYGLPSLVPKYVRIKAKPIIHSGPAFGIVTEVLADQIVCGNLAGLADDWSGRDVSVIADATDGSAALWNFPVTAYDAEAGAFTVSPSPEDAGVEPGDVLIVRTQADTITADSIGDSKFINGLYPDGIVGDESGALVRIIAGPGRGQVRTLTSHTVTVYSIDRPWDVMPTSESWFIVEDSAWRYFAESSTKKTRISSQTSRISMAAENMLSQTMLVGGFIVDRDDNESPEELSPMREIYLFGDRSNVKTYNGFKLWDGTVI